MILNKIYHTLVGYRSRIKYWGCSDVAHKMQQVHGITPKPSSATSKGWREWREEAQKQSRVGYWITEELLDHLQDIWMFVPDMYHNVRNKLHNIFISQSHVIKTDLPIGEWSDSNHRISSGLFRTIVDFVEQEKAHMNRMAAELSQEDDDQESLEIITDNRQAGLAHLDWEIELGDESPYQSAAAKEIKDIYLWIKDVYPTCPDPYDVHGWSEYCNSKEHIFETEDETPEEREHVRQMLDETHDLETEQRDEETEMLVRIVKARDQMWT